MFASWFFAFVYSSKRRHILNAIRSTATKCVKQQNTKCDSRQIFNQNNQPTLLLENLLKKLYCFIFKMSNPVEMKICSTKSIVTCILWKKPTDKHKKCFTRWHCWIVAHFFRLCMVFNDNISIRITKPSRKSSDIKINVNISLFHSLWTIFRF